MKLNFHPSYSTFISYMPKCKKFYSGRIIEMQMPKKNHCAMQLFSIICSFSEQILLSFHIFTRSTACLQQKAKYNGSKNLSFFYVCNSGLIEQSFQCFFVQVASMLPPEAFTVLRKSFDARKVSFLLFFL